MPGKSSENPFVDSTVNHLFRHEAGRMVAVLCRIFGAHNLELAEDVVQDTLLAALEQWKLKGIPDKPQDWLFIVAKNKALNLIKKQKVNVLFGDEQTHPLLQSGYTINHAFEQLTGDALVKEDQLRMMFACCHPSIPEEAQITLILKTLCGFSIPEIARAFLTNNETITKRLYRARQVFREGNLTFDIPGKAALQQRMEPVLRTIYLLLNEGYNATQHDEHIRKDLIEESFRLCHFLTENKQTDRPDVAALQALICFHAARISARTDTGGHILLLPDQDRSHWNTGMIELGMDYLDKSAQGTITVYHLEAAIASVHCTAVSFEATDWARLLGYYDLLFQLKPSPVVALNRVIVLSKLSGAAAALAAFVQISGKSALEKYYLYHATHGELLLQSGNAQQALEAYRQAFALTQSLQEQDLLQAKIDACKRHCHSNL